MSELAGTSGVIDGDFVQETEFKDTDSEDRRVAWKPGLCSFPLSPCPLLGFGLCQSIAPRAL